MSFDLMAATVDWLDAYRDGDLDGILDMYADDAVIDCSCCVKEIVTGRDRLKAFWTERLKDCVPSNLEDLRPLAEGVSVSYVGPNGVANVVFRFGHHGKITFMRWCAPK